MAVSKNVLAASCLSGLGTLLVMVAFVTGNWLVADDSGHTEQRRFGRIGLWVVCFENLGDSHNWYDVKLVNTCGMVFRKKFTIFHDILFGNNFYRTTQLSFTVCVLCAAVGLVHVGRYVRLGGPVDGYRVKTVSKTGAVFLVSSVFGTVALVIFGNYGAGGTWMPDWRHNHIGWSYGVGVAGTIALWIGGILYAIEGRALKIKLRKRIAIARKSNSVDKLQAGRIDVYYV